MGKSCIGRDGAHCVVKVPLGTIVHDRETGALVADIGEEGERVVATNTATVGTNMQARRPRGPMGF